MSDYTAQHIHKQVRGWLLPYLLDLDLVPGIGSGRWDYWLKICDTLNLPDDPIPQIHFTHGINDMPWHSPFPDDLKEHPFKHLQRVLEPYLWAGGGWYDDAWLAFARWLLHGFGRRGLEDEVNRIPENVRDH